MKAVVLREYTDRLTGKGHAIGEQITVTQERFSEIQSKGAFLKEVAEAPVKKSTKAPRKKKEGSNNGRV